MRTPYFRILTAINLLLATAGAHAQEVEVSFHGSYSITTTEIENTDRTISRLDLDGALLIPYNEEIWLGPEVTLSTLDGPDHWEIMGLAKYYVTPPSIEGAPYALVGVGLGSRNVEGDSNSTTAMKLALGYNMMLTSSVAIDGRIQLKRTSGSDVTITRTAALAGFAIFLKP